MRYLRTLFFYVVLTLWANTTLLLLFDNSPSMEVGEVTRKQLMDCFVDICFYTMGITQHGCNYLKISKAFKECLVISCIFCINRSNPVYRDFDPGSCLAAECDSSGGTPSHSSGYGSSKHTYGQSIAEIHSRL